MILTLRGGLGNQIIQIAYMLRQTPHPQINTYAVTLRPQLREIPGVRYCSVAVVHYLFGAIRKAVSLVRSRATDIRLGGIYDGYFQYGDMTDLIPDTMKHHLVSQIAADPSVEGDVDVVLHIRGGDYFSGAARDLYATCTADYYLEGLQRCRDTLAKDVITVYVVTNDQAYARELLAPLNEDGGVRLIVYSGDEWGDFSLLYRATAAVIPNSTFSMTARMLRDEGLTVAPHPWFLAQSSLTAPYDRHFTYVEFE